MPTLSHNKSISIAALFFISALSCLEPVPLAPPQVAAVTFSQPSGTYVLPILISLNTSTQGASIYYTTNGDDPTTNGTLYTRPISVDSSQTIRAYATRPAYLDSDVTEAAYLSSVGIAKIRISKTVSSGGGADYVPRWRRTNTSHAEGSVISGDYPNFTTAFDTTLTLTSTISVGDYFCLADASFGSAEGTVTFYFLDSADNQIDVEAMVIPSTNGGMLQLFRTFSEADDDYYRFYYASSGNVTYSQVTAP